LTVTATENCIAKELYIFVLIHQVALSKANSESGGMVRLESLVSQDLCPGEGGTVELGDSVEIRFTSWLITDFTFGAVSRFSQLMMALYCDGICVFVH